MYVIGRPINGISINGREYALDSNGETLKFVTEEDAKKFLERNKVTEEMIQNEGIDILEESICNLGSE